MTFSQSVRADVGYYLQLLGRLNQKIMRGYELPPALIAPNDSNGTQATLHPKNHPPQS